MEFVLNYVFFFMFVSEFPKLIYHDKFDFNVLYMFDTVGYQFVLKCYIKDLFRFGRYSGINFFCFISILDMSNRKIKFDGMFNFQGRTNEKFVFRPIKMGELQNLMSDAKIV